MILSIDPGNEYSAYSLLDKNLKPVKFGKVLNHDLLIILEELFLIECITDVAIGQMNIDGEIQEAPEPIYIGVDM